jgi:hypothetical protein
MTLAQPRDRGLEDVRTGAEDEDRQPTTLGQLEQPHHQVDAGDALRDGCAEQPRGPDHGLAVGVDELAPVDDLSQPLVVA